MAQDNTLKDTISVLNDLIETSKDGEYGFRTCSEKTASPELKSVFSQRAEECRRGAEELQSLVVQIGGSPADRGTAAGALHRGWASLRGTVTGHSDQSMLDECERGEDVALTRYRKALTEATLPASVRAVIERQMQGVQRNHDQVKALRDRYKSLT